MTAPLEIYNVLNRSTCKWAYKITTFEERKPGTREFGRLRSIVYSKLHVSIHNLNFFM